jgi:uncharacterized MAPEG superfamily protein
MSHSILALLVYGAWSVLLLLGILLMRSWVTLSGQRAANNFSVSGDDVSPFSGRLCRAHANCYESLPAFAAIVLAAHLSGNAHITDALALWLVVARIFQSIVHLISISLYAVMIRFTFQLVQVSIQLWWLIGMAGLLQ